MIPTEEPVSDARERTGDIEWVQVMTGTVMEATLVRAQLEGRGIPTFWPDEHIKHLDPFVTGAGAFATHLCVPSEDREAALAVIAEGQEARAEETEGAEESSGRVGVEEATDMAWRIGRRMRFGALFVFTAPLTLLFAPSYFRITRQLPHPPPDHRLTVAAVWLAGAILLGGIAWKLAPLLWFLHWS